MISFTPAYDRKPLVESLSLPGRVGLSSGFAAGAAFSGGDRITSSTVFGSALAAGSSTNTSALLDCVSSTDLSLRGVDVLRPLLGVLFLLGVRSFVPPLTALPPDLGRGELLLLLSSASLWTFMGLFPAFLWLLLSRSRASFAAFSSSSVSSSGAFAHRELIRLSPPAGGGEMALGGGVRSSTTALERGGVEGLSESCSAGFDASVGTGCGSGDGARGGAAVEAGFSATGRMYFEIWLRMSLLDCAGLRFRERGAAAG